MQAIIETERLILRKFSSKDVDSVYQFGSNETVNKYTGDIVLTSKKQALNIIENVFKNDYKTYGYGRLAVIYKPDNNLIGFAGLKYLPEFDKTDIGFRFLPIYWNKGVATEAAKELIKYGFKTLKLHEIIGIANPNNIGSCKVLEKIGMSYYKSDIYDNTDPTKYNWYKITALNHQ